MINFLLAGGVFVGLFILLFVSIKVGYRFGEWKRTRADQLGIVKVVEGTVFALLGLFVAFTFSGAYDRFENRKLKIVEEVNTISTAYMRIVLLKPTLQADMRTLFENYLDERIATYGRLAEFRNITTELARLKMLESLVWNKSVVAAEATNNNAATLLFLPAVGNMFDVAATRIMITRIHPPAQIFILLIGLAALSSFLAGYGMAKNKVYSFIYTFCFAAITAFTLYVIIDLEFPRVGLIRVDGFDQMLVELRHNMK